MSFAISQEHLDKLQEAREVEGVYLANSLQQGFIYHSISQGSVDDAYIVQGIWEYNNKLDISKLKEAWMYAQKRYPSLRLRLVWEEELLQVVDREGSLDWRYIDLSKEKDAQAREFKIKQIQEDDRAESYRLELGNLFRVYLIKQQEDLYTCILSNHHAILDGWSSPVLLSYVHETYLKLESKEKVILSIDHSYKDAQRYFQSHNNDNKSYWEEYISTIEERGDLSGLLNISNKNIKISEYKLLKDSQEQTLVIGDKLYIKLKELGKSEGITLNAILQFAWHKILNIYGNSNQTIAGVIVSGRNLPINDIESSVGMFINTLPLIVNHQNHKEDNILELIRSLQDNINEVNSRSVVSLAKLQKWGGRLFDSLFIYENYPSTSENYQNKLNINFKEGIEKLDYPLAAIAYEANNKLNFKLKFAGELFSNETIDQILSIIENLLEQIASDPYKKVKDLNYLATVQQEQIIYSWNETDRKYNDNKTIHELFEEQVEGAPDNIAVKYGEIKLTYRELNERANQLANYLREAGEIAPDTLIALCFDRNEHMLIAILAVLKAGGAYVPMDASYPDERIKYILEDTGTKVILTNKLYQQKLEDLSTNITGVKVCILAIDDINVQKQLTTQSVISHSIKVPSTNLAYIIYTSGTTGNPKGVMVEHKAYVATIDCVKDLYFTKEQKIRTYSTTNYVFDIFGLEYGLPLLSGGIISIGTSEFSSLDCAEFDFIQMTPSLCDLRLDDLTNTTDSTLIIGGESLSSSLLNSVLNKSINVINAYGPTETTIWSTSKLYTHKETAHPLFVSLGKSFNNEKLYVLDSNLTPLPIGAIGELYIGGVGLARGYLNRPDLTAEKFITNPFQTDEEKSQNKNVRLYKTGDLVRWLADGDLEYIGQNDFQVKIRGYRIELEEIEAALLGYDGIKQSIVIAREHKNPEGLVVNKYLVGYYVSKDKLEENNILNYLHSELPDYMVPSILVHLEELPLTVNGKLDRKALPDPEFTDSDNYVAPRNELEAKVCQVWAEVLGIAEDKVGIRDDFFRLGGNSILAIKLISKINKALNVNIIVSSIFKHNTVEKLVNYLDHNMADNVVIEKSIITRKEDQALSFAQERLWFIEKYEEGTNAYNISMVFKLKDGTRLDILESAIRDIVSRHEILRTVVKEDSDGNGYQVVLDDKERPLEITTLEVNSQTELDQELERQVNHIYDLSNEYPIRVYLYELSKNGKRGYEHYLSIIIHHIAFDGWSIDILLRELQELYNHYLKQSQGLASNLNLPELSIQYKDFAIWQRSYLTGERLDKQLSYWNNKLNGYEPLNLITDKPRPVQIDYRGKDIYFELEETTSIGLRELAKELKVSLYSLLLAGYYLMLRGYSNQDDIVIGTPIANRQYSQIENLIGLFINSLALRIEVDPSSSVKEFIQKIGTEVVEAQTHQDLPFEKLVEELKVPKDTSRHPIFQVMFGVQSFGGSVNKHSKEQRAENLTDITNLLQPYTTETSIYNIAKFDISTFIDDSEVQLKGSFNYAVNIYTETTIKRFIETYTEILSQMSILAKDSQKLENTKITDLNYLSSLQYEQIIYSWNQTDKEYPSNKTIHELFEAQVEKTPDNIAIVYEETKLTYMQLNNQANQLANYIIQKHNITPDTLIALCLDRSEHMLIGIVAVLKAGAAYVPMDPSYPDERIKYIVEDTNTKLILTNEAYQERLKQRLGDTSQVVNSADAIELTRAINDRTKILAIDSEWLQDELQLQTTTNPKTETTSTNLAYVIYTSGTTGNPKGVMIEHRGVVNLKYYLTSKYKLGNKNNSEVVLQLANYVFDASIEQMLLSLLNGYVLLVIPNQLWLNKEKFYYYLNINKVTHIHATPTLLAQYDFSKIFSLNRVISGGDLLSSDYYNNLVLQLHGNKIINEYGPTETTITSILNAFKNNNLTIGSPISNTKAYVLGSNLKPLPIGAIGELYIGGIGLARGYLNRPDLTAEKFILNPFQTAEEKNNKSYSKEGKNARLYKTGDLVRWLSDGDLEYIGRNDFQVKIRGYRIELGEIETVLSSYERIKQSVVLAKEHTDLDGASTGNKYLVGYYVANNKLNEEDILKYLQLKLPEYMVPSVLVYLKQLPLTVNGKLDRKSLPDPEFTSSDNYISPRNELEAKICQIWAEILGLAEDKVGIGDDFFRLGGDSIVSIQLVSRLRQRLGLNVSVKDIFSYKNIERLYDNIISKSSNDNTKLNLVTEQGILGGELSLLPIQEWFFESDFVEANHWNQSFIVKTPSLDLAVLQVSVAKLIEHHDSLRLRYRKSKDLATYIQHYDSSAKVEELKILDIRSLKDKEGSKEFKSKFQEVLTSWQSNFDLERGPIYSIGYIYGYNDGSSRIWFALHHLIVDTVSWRILAEDLKNIYNGKDLGSKGSSYRQWVEAITVYKNTHIFEKEYWNSVLADYDTNLLTKLVTNEKNCNYANLTLSAKQTKQLLQESNRTYNTQINDLLLTALGHILSEITNSKVNHIILEGHGREDIDSNIDVSRTIGWFTTMYPVRLEVSNGLGSSIKSTKEYLRKVPNKGIGYGSLIGYRSNKLPRISFNYLGQFDQEEILNTDRGNQMWSIVGEDSGLSINTNNHDNNLININGLVIDGSLSFGIVTKFDPKITKQFARAFKECLEDIIKHTTDQTRTYLTVSDVANIISQEYLDKIQEVRETEGVYLASSLQQGFIYHTLNQGNVDDAYLVQLVWQYNNQLEASKLQEAWSYAQKRYPSLRLRLAWQEELVQVIDKEGSLDWRYIDLSKEQDIQTQELKIKQIQEEDRLEQYKLEQGNLFRVYLIKQRKDLYTCIFSNHHAILDGWSSPILLGYVHETYLRLQGKETILASIDHSYEYAQKYLQDHQDDNNDYWDKYISQIEERVDLSGLLSAASKHKHLIISEYKHIIDQQEGLFTIKDSLYRGLKELSQKEGVTLNAILQYVWHKVLNIYGNSNQTVVGATISGRNLPIHDIESSVGLYINTLPLIVDHQTQQSKSIIESIKAIQDNINEINSRSDVSLAKLQKGGQRLFDSLFIYENYPNPTDEEQQSKLKISFTGSIEKLDYPLAVIAYEANNELTFKLSYAGELFSEEAIERLLGTVDTILVQILRILQDRKLKSKDLTYLNREDEELVLREWNDTDKLYPHDKTIHQLFEEQVEKTPDNIAIVYAETRLTYRELNNRANQLANYLRRQGVTRETFVAICLERSIELVIGLIGILKAGGVYIPLDPSHPDKRLHYILNDTNAPILIIQSALTQRFLSYQGIILNIDKDKKIYKENKNNLDNINDSCNLLYIMYTSGSTGEPKGVPNVHQGLVNRMIWSLSNYPIDEQDSLLQIAAVGFDISVWEMMFPLLAGGRLVIGISEESKDPKYLVNTIIKEKISIIHFVPSLLKAFLDYHNGKECISIKQVVCGGEAISVDLRKKFFEHLSSELYHAYGPTEAAISVIHWNCRDKLYEELIPIGSPISNTKIYVLDNHLTPLPIGAIGELYIGGAGLARGYLNRPDLTEEKFIQNPFQSEEEKDDKSYSKEGKNARLYKTGDLVRWLLDGNLEYIGRNDFQVKIRGYRIELGEIESALSSYAGVKQSVVLAKEHVDADLTGSKYLVGYYVSEDKLDEEAILSYLKSRLPEYMVPSILVHLEELPLTINGKLDRKGLPDPEFTSGNDYVRPRNDVEKKIVDIWSEVLGLPAESIGIYDNFFRFGGNSLLTVKVTAQINKAFNISLTIRDMFLFSSIVQLSSMMEKYTDKLKLKINDKSAIKAFDIYNADFELAKLDSKRGIDFNYTALKKLINIITFY